MSEVLLVNPRRRRRRSANPKRRRRNPTSYRAVTRRRRKNPIALSTGVGMSKYRRRRRNPISKRRVFRRRRSNPISARGLLGGIVPMVKNAALGAAGSIGVDLAMKQINPMLPAMLQPTPGRVGANDAVKIVATVVLGRLLSRFTRGMSVTAAQGALTVQMNSVVRNVLPDSIKMQLAYATAAPVVQGSQRVGPTPFRAYVQPGSPSPMLNAYTSGPSTLLNRARGGNAARASMVNGIGLH